MLAINKSNGTDKDINYKNSTIIIQVEVNVLTGEIIYQGETTLEELTDGN
jgi:PBP1b-binding outer membrane lipoprotein LpoB